MTTATPSTPPGPIEASAADAAATGAASDAARLARAKRRRLIIQIIGIVAGLASLAWCINMAFAPENRAQWARLGEASAGQIAIILALSAASLACEGLIFWTMIRPVKPIRLLDMQAANALCTFLSYLPFKLSAVARFLIHNRRDGVPIPTILSWFGNCATVLLLTFVPMIALAAAFKSLGAGWMASTAASAVAAIVGLTVLGRVFQGQRGIERLIAILRAVRLRRLEPLLRTQVWRNLHAGFDMFASPVNNTISVALRLAHGGILLARFLAVAALFGLAIPAHDALTLAIVFFLLGAASPAGMAGLREGAVPLLAGVILATSGGEGSAAAQYAPVAILLSATEALVFLVCAGLGLAWLRPDKLMRLRSVPAPAMPQAAASPAP